MFDPETGQLYQMASSVLSNILQFNGGDKVDVGQPFVIVDNAAGENVKVQGDRRAGHDKVRHQRLESRFGEFEDDFVGVHAHGLSQIRQFLQPFQKGAFRANWSAC